MKNKYYISISIPDGFIGMYYCVDFNLNTIDGIQKMQKKIRDDGYPNAVILFFKALED